MNQIAYDKAGHRDGEFQFSHPTADGWTPCSALEDFLLTFGTFVLGLAPIVAVAYWMLM